MMELKRGLIRKEFLKLKWVILGFKLDTRLNHVSSRFCHHMALTLKNFSLRGFLALRTNFSGGFYAVVIN